MKWSCFILVLLMCSATSCKKSTNADTCDIPNPDCTTVRCPSQSYLFNFKIVDANSGADLVFGDSPRYAISDIKLFEDAARTIPVAFSANASSRQFTTTEAKSIMYLVVQGGSVYTLTVDFKTVSCCENEVLSLKVNNSTVCNCCFGANALPVN